MESMSAIGHRLQSYGTSSRQHKDPRVLPLRSPSSGKSRQIQLALVCDSMGADGKAYSAGESFAYVKTGTNGWTLVRNADGCAFWLPTDELRPLNEVKAKKESLGKLSMSADVSQKRAVHEIKVDGHDTVGVGMELYDAKSGAVCIREILPNGPAALSGKLALHDQIVSIDNNPCKHMEASKVSALLEGRSGSPVHLLVRTGLQQYSSLLSVWLLRCACFSSESQHIETEGSIGVVISENSNAGMWRVESIKKGGGAWLGSALQESMQNDQMEYELRAGDFIETVDQVSVRHIPDPPVVLRGPSYTRVCLGLLRGKKPLFVDIIRCPLLAGQLQHAEEYRRALRQALERNQIHAQVLGSARQRSQEVSQPSEGAKVSVEENGVAALSEGTAKTTMNHAVEAPKDLGEKKGENGSLQNWSKFSDFSDLLGAQEEGGAAVHQWAPESGHEGLFSRQPDETRQFGEQDIKIAGDRRQDNGKEVQKVGPENESIFCEDLPQAHNVHSPTRCNLKFGGDITNSSMISTPDFTCVKEAASSIHAALDEMMQALELRAEEEARKRQGEDEAEKAWLSEVTKSASEVTKSANRTSYEGLSKEPAKEPEKRLGFQGDRGMACIDENKENCCSHRPHPRFPEDRSVGEIQLNGGKPQSPKVCAGKGSWLSEKPLTGSKPRPLAMSPMIVFSPGLFSDS